MAQLLLETHLVKVEYQIQLTNIAKVAVQNFHKMVNDLKSDQLIIPRVYTHNKVQACIPLVHNLQVHSSAWCSSFRRHSCMCCTASRNICQRPSRKKSCPIRILCCHVAFSLLLYLRPESNASMSLHFFSDWQLSWTILQFLWGRATPWCPGNPKSCRAWGPDPKQGGIYPWRSAQKKKLLSLPRSHPQAVVPRLKAYEWKIVLQSWSWGKLISISFPAQELKCQNFSEEAARGELEKRGSKNMAPLPSPSACVWYTTWLSALSLAYSTARQSGSATHMTLCGYISMNREMTERKDFHVNWVLQVQRRTLQQRESGHHGFSCTSYARSCSCPLRRRNLLCVSSLIHEFNTGQSIVRDSWTKPCTKTTQLLRNICWLDYGSKRAESWKEAGAPRILGRDWSLRGMSMTFRF